MYKYLKCLNHLYIQFPNLLHLIKKAKIPVFFFFFLCDATNAISPCMYNHCYHRYFQFYMQSMLKIVYKKCRPISDLTSWLWDLLLAVEYFTCIEDEWEFKSWKGHACWKTKLFPITKIQSVSLYALFALLIKLYLFSNTGHCLISK